MKQSKKKNRKPSSRSHAVKTQEERDIYDQKVKLTESEGSTKEPLPSKTSTLSSKSVYGSSQKAGIPDRDPISPPKSTKWSVSKVIACIVGILTIIGFIVGFTIWTTTLKNKIDFNNGKIEQIDQQIQNTGNRYQDIHTRLVRIEEWKDVFSKDIDQIKNDLKNGVSMQQIDLKLLELEQRILKEGTKNKRGSK